MQIENDTKEKTSNFFEVEGLNVPRKGFEPLTHGLENRCSIQLSYRGPFCNELQI